MLLPSLQFESLQALPAAWAHVLRQESAQAHLERAKQQADPQRRLEELERALALARAGSQKALVMECLTYRAQALIDLGRTKDALAALDEVIPMLRRDKSYQLLASALLLRGQALFGDGDHVTAIASIRESLAIRRSHLGKAAQAVALTYLGSYQCMMGKLDEGLASLKQALPLLASTNAWDDLATTHLNIGTYLYEQGKTAEAESHLRKSIDLRRRAPNPREEAAALANLGVIKRSAGLAAEALVLYERALQIVRKSGDQDYEAAILSNIGNLQAFNGEPLEALETFETALVLARKSGDWRFEMATLRSLGRTYASMGELQTALKRFDQALALRRDGIRQADVASIYVQAGGVWYALGDIERTRDYHTQALKLYVEASDQEGQALVINNQGVMLDREGERLAALRSFRQALTIYRSSGNRLGEADVLSNMGGAWERLEDDQRARVCYLAALDIHRSTGNVASHAVTLSNLAKLDANEGDLVASDRRLFEALAMSRKAKNRSLQSQILYSLSQNAHHRKQDEVAIVYAKLAVRVTEDLKRFAAPTSDIDRIGDAARRSYGQALGHVYNFLAKLLQDQGRIAETLDVQGLFKDRELAEFEGKRSEGARDVELSNEEAALWRLLEHRLGAGALAESRRTTEEVIESWIRALPPIDPSALRLEQAKSLDPLKAVLARVGKTAASMVFLTPESVRVWVVTEDSDFTAETRVSGERLNQLVAELAGSLRSPALDPRVPGAELYELLVRPIEAHLKQRGVETVMWSLDGPLRYIPMSVLWDREQSKFVLEKWATPIFRLKAYQLTDLTDQPDWSIAAFAAGRSLPGALSEVRRIVDSVLKGEVFIDDQFTANALQGQLASRRHPVQHWASHFMCNPGDMRTSYLLLGDGSRLPLETIAQWGPAAFAFTDLLCLSACETAVGLGDGSEVEGLAALALNRGAKAVLATLWPIDDSTTPDLLRAFYANRKKGLSKAEALRQAQIRMVDRPASGLPAVASRGAGSMKGSRSDLPRWPADPVRPYAHPHYWAGFILAGNWK